MIWDEKHECMKKEERESLQLERLKETVARVYKNVAPYRAKMDEKGVKPGDIKGLEDLALLPFTAKTDLRDTYPFGLFAVPVSETVRVHCSSGTTGKPIVVGYTAADIDIWAETMARTIAGAGGSAGDIIQNAYGYGLFTGGLGIHYGGERVGATVIPISGGNTERQLMLLEDFGATMLASTPSYSLYIAEVAQDKGVDIVSFPLRCGILGAEAWSDTMRKEVEKRLGIKAYDIYGLTEVIGPGVSFECEKQHGMHICDDHFIPEIIDPETGEVLPAGAKGELVFTTITKEAFPVVRYRTRDITRLIGSPCECGRTSVRMERVSGRTDDMLIVRGVNVFPSQIEDVLMRFAGAEPHYLIVVDKRGAMDELEVQVEVSEGTFSDEVKELEDLRARIAHEVESVLGVRAVIKLVESRSIERSIGKAKRVVDKRNL